MFPSFVCTVTPRFICVGVFVMSTECFLLGGDGHSSVMYVRLGFEQSEESLAVQEITDKITNFNIETDTEANINTDTGNVSAGD